MLERFLVLVLLTVIAAVVVGIVTLPTLLRARAGPGARYRPWLSRSTVSCPGPCEGHGWLALDGRPLPSGNPLGPVNANRQPCPVCKGNRVIIKGSWQVDP